MTKLLFAVLFAVSPVSFAKMSAGPDLFKAAVSGDLATLRRHKKSLKTKTAAGESLLMKAAGAGRLVTVKWLAQNGADLNETDRDGGTALFYAVSSGEKETALFLIDKGADLEKTYGEKKESLVFETVRLGQNEVLRRILSKAPSLAQRTNEDGETALFEAVRSAQSESAKILLEKGADKSVRDKKGRKAVDLTDPKTDSALIRILS